jgi:hypothetical protein
MGHGWNAMTPSRPFVALREFARPRPRAERCHLCGAELPAAHEHLIEPATRRLVCSCVPCALLFPGQEGAKYRRVPRRVQALNDFRMTDAQWDDLCVPISLAFFFHSSAAGRVVALYPSPAGAMESLLTLEGWQELSDVNPILRELEPDVEALLVNRVGEARAYYRVPIDKCYRLVGLIRSTWRGLSGGAEVWEVVGRFFAELERRSEPDGEATHA